MEWCWARTVRPVVTGAGVYVSIVIVKWAGSEVELARWQCRGVRNTRTLAGSEQAFPGRQTLDLVHSFRANSAYTCRLPKLAQSMRRELDWKNGTNTTRKIAGKQSPNYCVCPVSLHLASQTSGHPRTRVIRDPTYSSHLPSYAAGSECLRQRISFRTLGPRIAISHHPHGPY